MYNRRFLFAQLGGDVSGARRHGRPLSIALLDLDRFKAINDRTATPWATGARRGRARAARRLRAEDVLGAHRRRGVPRLLPDTGEEAAAQRGRELRCGTPSPGRARPRAASRRASARPRWDGEAPDDLVRRADEALYAAKAAGREHSPRRSCYPASPHMTMTAEEKGEITAKFGKDETRHRGHRGPDRAAHAPHQPPDRAPARAQARPPLASRPAHARRPPPPLPELPPEEGPGGVPLAHPRARPAPLARDGGHRGRAGRRPTSRSRTLRGRRVHARRLLRAHAVLVFYPFAFSPVCTDQLSLYNEVLDDFAERGATLYGVSCDAVWAQQAFREQLGIDDRAAVGLRAQGRGLPRVRRAAPGRLPAARAGADRARRGRALELRRRRRRRPPGRQPPLRRARRAAAVSAVGDWLRPAAAARPGRPRPRAGRRAAGRSSTATTSARSARRSRSGLRELPLRVAFRHFPVRASHPRAFAAACAAEAAGSRTRSGRSTTRCSPTRAGSRIRTCGRGPSGSGSTSRASTPTAARTPSLAGSRRLPRGRRAASRPRRRCSSAGSATPGAPTPALWARLACGARTPVTAGAYTRRDRPPRTPSWSSACAPTRRARRCARSTGSTAASSRLRAPLAGRPRGCRGDRAGGLPARLAPRRALRPERAAVRTWLYQIARHAIIDARRRASVRPGCRARARRRGRARRRRDARAGDARLAGRRGARAAHARAPPDDPAWPSSAA